MRDLLTVLGVDSVTVGHSFGGGVAMQFAYQFPERTERIVLISTGGLGRDVTRLIRFLTLPGSGVAVSLATLRPWRPLVSAGLSGDQVTLGTASPESASAVGSMIGPGVDVAG
ncbi:MAG: alpha/beta fold hydrolase [Aeromicrobium sp.]